MTNAPTTPAKNGSINQSLCCLSITVSRIAPDQLSFKKSAVIFVSSYPQVKPFVWRSSVVLERVDPVYTICRYKTGDRKESRVNNETRVASMDYEK